MFETLDFGSNNNKIKGPLGCLVSVKKGLKYTLLNSYVIYACNIYREFIKDFRATKKIGFLRKFTISGDRESRDGGTFCWDNI